MLNLHSAIRCCSEYNSDNYTNKNVALAGFTRGAKGRLRAWYPLQYVL
jgi:hypothetical protein